MKRCKGKFMRTMLNYKIHYIRKVIVFLCNILDKLLQKKGKVSYRKIADEKNLPIRKFNDNVYEIMLDGQGVGKLIGSDFNMIDSCLFDPYIRTVTAN